MGAACEAVSPDGRAWQGRIDLLEVSQALERPQRDGRCVDSEVSPQRRAGIGHAKTSHPVQTGRSRSGTARIKSETATTRSFLSVEPSRDVGRSLRFLGVQIVPLARAQRLSTQLGP